MLASGVKAATRPHAGRVRRRTRRAATACGQCLRSAIMPIIAPDLSHFELTPTVHSTEISNFESASSPSSLTLISGKPLPAPTKQRPRNDRLPESVEVAPTPPAPPATQKAYDLEAARKAKAVESQLRETFRQTLLRLKRPRERKAALLALEQMANATEGIMRAGVRLYPHSSYPPLRARPARMAPPMLPQPTQPIVNAIVFTP